MKIKPLLQYWKFYSLIHVIKRQGKSFSSTYTKNKSKEFLKLELQSDIINTNNTEISFTTNFLKSSEYSS